MSRLTAQEKADEQAQLNTRVPAQALVGGKAVTRPSGTRQRQGQNKYYGERVTHGVTDTVVRYIVVTSDTDVNEYHSDIGWYYYTHEQARGF